MNDVPSQNNEIIPATEKPGGLLREARLKQELTVDDIFKRIHLEPRVIEALEADDYDKIPSGTYARGYLRTYAKTLGLDGDTIVALYNADNAPPPPDILPEVKPPSQVSSSDKPVKAFTYLVSLGLVLLLLIWYQSNFVVDKDSVQSPIPDENNVALPAQINNTNTDFDVVVHPQGWETPEATPEAINDAMPDLLGQNAAPANDIVVEQIEQQENQTSEPLPQALDTLPVDGSDNTRAYVYEGPDSIELNISDDSWVEIYDVNEERVFMDLGEKGERLLIKGTAPFSLILGYSPGVEIKFNGNTFDTEPYSTNGVARFELPPE